LVSTKFVGKIDPYKSVTKHKCSVFSLII